jgi:hypothetical protein
MRGENRENQDESQSWWRYLGLKENLGTGYTSQSANSIGRWNTLQIGKEEAMKVRTSVKAGGTVWG